MDATTTLFAIPPVIERRQKAIKKALIDLDITAKAFAEDHLGRTRAEVSNALGKGLRRVTDPEGLLREMEEAVRKLKTAKPEVAR